jgi:peptidoglycan/LPS O-acetylase OafA/YrhL
MSHTGASRSTGRIAGLDGLRAIAALSVLAFHAATITGSVRVGVSGSILNHLDVGVPIFFVLSGYLIYRPFLRAHVGGVAPPQIGRYLLRRFLRVFPAYWVALTVAAYVVHTVDLGGVGSALYYYGLLQIYSETHAFGGLVQTWSLATEVSFYVFVPIYAVVIRRFTRHRGHRFQLEWLGLAVLYGTSVLFRVYLLQTDAHLGYTWLPAHADEFALGMGIAVVAEDSMSRVGHAFRAFFEQLPGVAWIFAAALFVLLVNLDLPVGFDPITTDQHLVRQFLGGLIAAGLVGAVALAKKPRSIVVSLTSSKAIRTLGLASYGIFLWHLTLADKIADSRTWSHPSSFVPLLLATAVASTAMGVLSYVLVERPLLRAGDSRRRR